MNILYIDTSSNKEITVGIKSGAKKTEVKHNISVQKAQIVLPLIEKLLNKHKLKPKDISAIEVETGPGSFTGLRVGISVANALSFALGIPINGKKTNTITLPIYEPLTKK